MPKLLPAHRRKPNKRSKRKDRIKTKKDIFENDDDDSFDDSPRELLAVGAVLDHLCRGGQISDSTRVFLKEASRGRRRLDQETLPSPPSLLSSHLSCLSVCSNTPHEDTYQVKYEFRDDDYDVDDGYTIPTVALRRFNEDSKIDEDLTLTLDDLTLDEATLDTFDDDATIEMIDIDAVFDASRNAWHNLDPRDRLQVDPAFMEKYVNEEDVDEEILGAIALNVAQVEENLQDLVSDPEAHNVISPALLFGLSHDDDESVNSLAKKMHGMLQRRSSRLFATSDTKGDGHKAMTVRRRKKANTTPHWQTAYHFAMAGEEDDDLTFAVRKFDDEKDEPSIGPSTNTNCSSVLANAPNLPWPPSFPTSRNFRGRALTNDFPPDTFSGMSFVSHDETIHDTAATLSSRTTTSQTLVRGNGNARHSTNDRFDRFPSSVTSPSNGDNRRHSDSMTNFPSSPVQNRRNAASSMVADSPRARRSSLLKLMKYGSRKRNTGQLREEGILAPLVQQEIMGKGDFEVQQIKQERLEI